MLNTKEIREDFAAETSYSIAIEKRDPFETFAHYRIGKGLATLSVSVDEGVVSVGAAYCHPRDKMNKSFGRKVALARRELGSDFSFEFKRDDTRFTEQLRHEFNNFVEASRDEYVHALQYGQKNRVGSPPWIMFALHRQLKKHFDTGCLMVGWAKRNGLAELKRKNYNKWFNSLSPVKQQEIRQQKEEQWKKDRPKFIALMVFTCLFILSFCLAGSIIKLFIIQ